MSLSELLRTFNVQETKDEEAQAFQTKDTNGVSLKAVLQSGRLKRSRTRESYPQGLTFRPSSITYNYCRRAKVLHLAGVITLVDKPPTPKQQFVFDMGNAIHDIVQGYFWDNGQLKGSFKCLKCDKIYHDLLAPESCPSGKKTHLRKHLKYKEVIMKQPEYQISGRCDGILVIDGEEHLLDIKSIQNRTLKSHDRQFCFEDLEDGPKSDHVAQIMLYMWMSGIHNGHLFYVAKNDHLIKTFHIPYNYKVIEPYLVEMQHLLEVSQALRNGDKPKLPEPCAYESCDCHKYVS